jgi:hypothetical protein
VTILNKTPFGSGVTGTTQIVETFLTMIPEEKTGEYHRLKENTRSIE